MYRIRQKLYIKYVREKLYIGNFEELGRIDSTTRIWDKKSNVFVVMINKICYIFNRILDSYLEVAWGRYFRRPLISRFFMKINNCNPVPIKDMFLLKLVIDYKNKKRTSISFMGFRTLRYLLHDIKEHDNQKRIRRKAQ